MRDQRFTFLCDSTERRLIERLASCLHRSQGDAMRWLIRKASTELGWLAPDELQDFEFDEARQGKEEDAGELP